MKQTLTLVPTKPVLIVDSDASSLLVLQSLLPKIGINHTIICPDSQRIDDVLEQQPVSMLLLDLPQVSDYRLLQQLRQKHPTLPLVVVSNVDEIEAAVSCIKLGALDYIIKPVAVERLTEAFDKALAQRPAQHEKRAGQASAITDIVTQDPVVLSLCRYAESIAQSSEPVLVTGETGVGKELFAHAIHRLSRCRGSLVAVNMAGLDGIVFDETLFGRGLGPFSDAGHGRNGLVEQAANGTLFMDEIGGLSAAAQAKLLRLLADGDYFQLGQDTAKRSNARVISATNQDLWTLVERRRFRQDLNFRLRTHHIHVPPLRERRADIPLLFDTFLTQAARQLNRPKPAVSKRLLAGLADYAFPGNVRELRSLVFNAASVSQGSQLAEEPFYQHIQHQDTVKQPRLPTLQASESAPTAAVELPAVLDFSTNLPTLKEANALLLKEALRRANGNQSVAGRLLGISQQAVSKRLKSLTQTRLSAC